MSYVFDVEGWEDYDGNRHEGEPSDLSDTYGQFVHVYDPEGSGPDDWFWAFKPGDGVLESWDEWYDYIVDLMDMYGMAA